MSLLIPGYGLVDDSTSIFVPGFGLVASGAPATITLVVDDATHAHSAEEPTTTPLFSLLVASASHGHVAEGVVLSDRKVEFVAATGLTLTAQLFAVNSDVVSATSIAVMEQPNVKGMYVAEFNVPLLGPHLIVGYDGGTAVSAFYVMLDEATLVHRSGNYADVVMADTVELLRQIAQNKTVTDPATGLMTVYADDNTTPLLTAPLKEDVAETQPYRRQGAEVRGRLE